MVGMKVRESFNEFWSFKNNGLEVIIVFFFIL